MARICAYGVELKPIVGSEVSTLAIGGSSLLKIPMVKMIELGECNDTTRSYPLHRKVHRNQAN